VTTSFVTLRPSTVPLAAILNSLEGVLSYEDDVIARVMEDVAALNFRMDHQELSAAHNRLWEPYEKSKERVGYLGAVGLCISLAGSMNGWW